MFTRKLWHSTRFVREPHCGRGCPAIHKPHGAGGKLCFLTADVYASGFQTKLFTGKAMWWLALTFSGGEPPHLARNIVPRDRDHALALGKLDLHHLNDVQADVLFGSVVHRRS